MFQREAGRVAAVLESTGCVLTSFQRLGLAFEPDAQAAMIAALARTEQYADLEAAGRNGMLMFREEEPLRLARELVEPAVRALFERQPEALAALGTYAVNHYETGDFFNPHQDHFDGTVVIATLAGERDFDVYMKHVEDDVFVDVAATYQLVPGSLMVLDGFKNLGHAARCVSGPSISAVVDVPVALLAER